jgi:mRNA-degrading endonuclease toxin of MazEF toxin-antitoxin module
VRSMLAWLEQTWWFKNPIFGSRRNMILRRNLYAELGMTEVAVLTSKNGKRKFHFHQPECSVGLDSRLTNARKNLPS